MSDSCLDEIAPDERFLRRREVLAKCGLSKSEMYRRIDRGDFPRGRRLIGSQITFWLQSEVREWQAEQLRQAVAA